MNFSFRSAMAALCFAMITSAVAAGTVTFRDGMDDRPFTPSTAVGGASTLWTVGGFTLQPDASGPTTVTQIRVRLDGARSGLSSFELYKSDAMNYHYVFSTYLASAGGTGNDPGQSNDAVFTINDVIPANQERVYFVAFYAEPGCSGTIRGFVTDSTKITLESPSVFANAIVNEPLSTDVQAVPVHVSAFAIE